MVKNASELQYTTQVKSLITAIYGKSNSTAPSIYAQAQEYFDNKASVQKQLQELKQQLVALKGKKSAGLTTKDKKQLLHQIALVEQQSSQLKKSLAEAQLTRYDFMKSIVDEIISLAEGETFEESHRKSAKLLGTIQLTINTESKTVAEEHERCKPLYKSVLCLRLLDQLLLEDNLKSQYVLSRLKGISKELYLTFAECAPQKYQDYMEQVKSAVVTAALLQDIGNYHPDAQLLLFCEDGKADPFRTLSLEERKKLLQINHTETLHYVVAGIGMGKYIGDSKDEQALFNKMEKEKLEFINHMLKNWINPAEGIGNILKVPQIYTSIVLSTKPNYDFKLIPQVYQVLHQHAKKGFCNQEVVNSLEKITGMFPQGFGVTFIPKDSDGNDSDRFEYAIVSHLYPADIKQPVCRTVTRNLTFIARGVDVVVAEQNNLYFPETAKSLTKISKQRLDEILELLASNYHERKNMDMLPRCWHAKDYFSVARHQNLWNKAGS